MPVFVNSDIRRFTFMCLHICCSSHCVPFMWLLACPNCCAWSHPCVSLSCRTHHAVVCKSDGTVSLFGFPPRLGFQASQHSEESGARNEAQPQQEIVCDRNAPLIRLGGEIFSSPVVIGNHILVGCRDDKFYSLKATFD